MTKPKFKTGTKVEITDPMFKEEKRKGFIAKQVDEYHFLVKMESPFTYCNPHTTWMKVYRPFAHQAVIEL